MTRPCGTADGEEDNARLFEVENDTERIEKKVRGIEHELSDIESRLHGIERKVDSISEDSGEDDGAQLLLPFSLSSF